LAHPGISHFKASKAFEKHGRKGSEKAADIVTN
jgi:hypothetical protein